MEMLQAISAHLYSRCCDCGTAAVGLAEGNDNLLVDWWLGSRVVSVLSGNSLRQTVHTYRASVHQVAKLVATLLRVAGVTAGLAESNGSLPPGL